MCGVLEDKNASRGRMPSGLSATKRSSKKRTLNSHVGDYDKNGFLGIMGGERLAGVYSQENGR